MTKRFEWNVAKAELTRLKRGLLFEDATKLFMSGSRVHWWRDSRSGAEYRYSALGFIDGIIYQVVFVLRAGYRIISFRKAKKRERKEFEKFILEGRPAKGGRLQQARPLHREGV